VKTLARSFYIEWSSIAGCDYVLRRKSLAILGYFKDGTPTYVESDDVFTRSGGVVDQHYRNEKLIIQLYQYVAAPRKV